MTRKRYLAVAGLLAILVAAGYGVGMMLPDGPGVTKANFDRVQVGMTEADIVNLFGENGFSFNQEQIGKAFCKTWQKWIHDDDLAPKKIIEIRTAVIWFNNDGFVEDKEWNQEANPETIVEKLRCWLRL